MGTTIFIVLPGTSMAPMEIGVSIFNNTNIVESLKPTLDHS